MTKDEIEIETLAADYFNDPNRSPQKENALLLAIYENKNFILKIISKSASRHKSVVTDLKKLKHESVLETFENAKENFKIEENFVKYFSANLKWYTEEILKNLEKNENELILDDPVSSEDVVTTKADFFESDINIEKSVIEEIQLNDFFYTLLNSLNRLFLSTKAGMNNKSKVYTYFVLECLLLKPEKEFNRIIDSYDFLRLQKTYLIAIRKDLLLNRKFPTQEEYSTITGIPTTKFSGIRMNMELFLREDKEIQKYK